VQNFYTAGENFVSQMSATRPTQERFWGKNAVFLEVKQKCRFLRFFLELMTLLD
jgi:hypothetical protein